MNIMKKFAAASMISVFLPNAVLAQSDGVSPLDGLKIEPLHITKSCATENTKALIGTDAVVYNDTGEGASVSVRSPSPKDQMATTSTYYSFNYTPIEVLDNGDTLIDIYSLSHTYNTDFVGDPTWDGKHQTSYSGGIETDRLVDFFVDPAMNGKQYWIDGYLAPTDLTDYDIEGKLAEFYKALDKCVPRIG